MIEIILDDPWFLAINKPIDLLTQAPDEIPSLQQQLVQQLAPSMDNKPFIGIPHRLDRMTSGVLVVARNQRALRRLCDQFAQRTIGKEYVAWVEGSIDASGDWKDSIRKVPDEPRAERVDAAMPGARDAILSFEKLAEAFISPGQHVSLVKIRLETGRMHQIRVQFGSRGHPIVGDCLYGASDVRSPDAPQTRQPAIALHARRLDFFHPKTGEKMIALAKFPTTQPWSLACFQPILAAVFPNP